jgi:hypothetical protein
MELDITLKDLAQEGYVYHVASIIDLQKTLDEGLCFDDKNTYFSKYYDFHSYFDSFKPASIPLWVERKKAIFASLNFKKSHTWHSHTAVLKVRIRPEKCWICNENIANFIYEPFILQNLNEFGSAREYISINGRNVVEEYWALSLSYMENLEKRYDKREGYDAEVLILHDIPPQDIECLYIVADHEVMSLEEWKKAFEPGLTCLTAQNSRYLQPSRMYSAWNISGSQ